MANKIYSGQTELRIRLTTGVSISGATCQVKYKKPSGQEGAWDATIEDAAAGIIYYNVTSGDIDESGTWRFWAGVTWGDGDFAPGEGMSVKIFEEGD